MSRNVVFSSGDTLNLDLYRYAIAGNAIQFTDTGLNVVTITTLAGMAQFVKDQLDRAQSGTTIIKDTSFELFSIDQSLIDVSIDPITIRGIGFTTVNIQWIFFEDSSGGLDSNGCKYAVTTVDDNTLTAVFSSAGDGILGGASVSIYAQVQTTNLKSNALLGTNVSGTLVTIP